ncbi:MAG TPA: hypothetical protein VFZ70_01435 [Euzebyales bacterium]
MTDHLFVAHRHIVTEHALSAYPPETQHHFRGDPADWLPGRLTMHGGSTFHMRTRFLGANVTLQYTVGPPWMRGDTATRSLRIEFLERPFGMAWLLPVVEGELTLWGDPRPRIRFKGRSVVSGLFGVRMWSARSLVRGVSAGITDRLSAQAPPVPPSKASPAR